MTLLLWLGASAILAFAISWLCDKFEPAADYLGRQLPAGVKGATINAVGSSMPELWTAVALLFFVGNSESFSAGISLTAGSAVFNMHLIPFAVIMVASSRTFFRLCCSIRLIPKSDDAKFVSKIKIQKTPYIRDTIFLLLTEVALIFVLNVHMLHWYHGAILCSLYLPYIAFMLFETKRHKRTTAPDKVQPGQYKGINSARKAWFQLGWCTLGLVFVCYILGEAVIHTAHVLNVHAIITGLFLGAAVSSIPDTILSMKDARKGNTEDALANPMGSNIFDICICLGAPLTAYTLLFGPIELPSHGAVQLLRVGLVLLTGIVALGFLVPKVVTKWTAWYLCGFYLIWVVFALNTEFHWLKFSH